MDCHWGCQGRWTLGNPSDNPLQPTRFCKSVLNHRTLNYQALNNLCKIGYRLNFCLFTFFPQKKFLIRTQFNFSRVAATILPQEVMEDPSSRTHMQRVQVTLRAQDPLLPLVPRDTGDMVHHLDMEGTVRIRTRPWDRMDTTRDMHLLLNNHMVGRVNLICFYCKHNGFIKVNQP